MNAEQLHSIARELDQIVEQTGVQKLLDRLQTALQNQISQPQQAQHQAEVQEARRALMTSLTESPFNQWSANKRQISREIGADGLFGESLADRIAATFQENSATPEVIRRDVEKINTELRGFLSALKNLVGSLGHFGIAFEELKPDEGEIGLQIPRLTDTDSLQDFAKDLRRLDFEVKTVSEIVTGSAETNRIRTISSTDFLIFVMAIPEIVNTFSNIVTLLRYGYEKVQQLRGVLEQLRALGNASDDTINNLKRDIEDGMGNEVASVIEKLQPMYQAALDRGHNDLQVRVESTVRGLASRIDKGYTFSFRVGPPVVKKADDPTPEEKRKLDAAENIAKNNKRLQEVKLIEPGQAVLPLEWQTPDPSDNDDENES